MANEDLIEDWVKNLKVGDLVVASSRNGFGVLKVEKLPKTQIVLSNGQRFNKKTLRSTSSDTWNPFTLEEYTDKHKRILERGRLIKKINSYDIDSADLDKLERLAVFYSEIFDKD